MVCILYDILQLPLCFTSSSCVGYSNGIADLDILISIKPCKLYDTLCMFTAVSKYNAELNTPQSLNLFYLFTYPQLCLDEFGSISCS